MCHCATACWKYVSYDEKKKFALVLGVQIFGLAYEFYY